MTKLSVTILDGEEDLVRLQLAIEEAGFVIARDVWRHASSSGDEALDIGIPTNRVGDEADRIGAA